MLTNPMETQLVSSMGVKIGGREVPAQPMELARTKLEGGRDDAFVLISSVFVRTAGRIGSRKHVAPPKRDTPWIRQRASSVHQQRSFVAHVVGLARGNPKQIRDFFLNLNDRLRLTKTLDKGFLLTPKLLQILLRCVWLLRLPPSLFTVRLAQAALCALTTPIRQLRRVQTFPTQQLTDLARFGTTVRFFDDA
jgi:hypothetical protein